MATNDNDRISAEVIPPAADAHGHAALLLAESLIHGLIRASILTPRQSLEIVETAADVQADYVVERDGTRREMQRSHLLLTRIADSLRADIDFPEERGAAAPVNEGAPLSRSNPDGVDEPS